MDFAEIKVNEFLYELGSKSPAPGGGSACALAGTMGCALTSMVSGLTLGRKKYQEHDDLMKEIIEEINVVRDNLKACINQDIDAYNSVMNAFALPKETEEEKSQRKHAVQSALKEATVVPFRMMQLARTALEATNKLRGKSNTNAASDLGVAALNLKSCIQGAWLNVLINLGSINDSQFIEKYKEEGQEIVKIALPLADEIYNEVLHNL